MGLPKLKQKILILLLMVAVASCSPAPDDNSRPNSEPSTKTPTSPTPTLLNPTPAELKVFPTNTASVPEACLSQVSSLSIRESPETESTVVGYMMQGDCSDILEETADGSWYRIKAGWVSSFYLDVNGTTAELTNLSGSENLPVVPPPSASACHPSYPSVCLAMDAGDYDCAGGSGNGPNYVKGPIVVLPPDPFDLDRDGDGLGCE